MRGKQKKKNTVIGMLIGAVLILVLAVAGIVYAWGHSKKNNAKQGEDVSSQVEEQEYDATKCVELGEYKGIKVSLAVTKDEIESEVNDLLEEHARYEELTGTVADGDMIYADFEGYVDGQKVSATCGSDYIEIGSGDWLDGFESSLVGAVTGQTAIFTIPVAAGTYGDDTIDGHDVEFHVAVQYICGEEILPEYNDDFVRSISKKYKTVKEYNAYLKKKLKKEYEEQKPENTWTEVMDLCKVKTYPKSLMDIAREENLQDYYGMADLYGISHDEVFASFGYTDEADFVENALDELAQDSVKEYLISEAISQIEKISYSDKEYSDTLEEEYSYVEDNYDSKEAFEAAKTDYIKRKALLYAVKQWLTTQAEYSY